MREDRLNRRRVIEFVLLATVPCILLGAGATSRPANSVAPDTAIRVTPSATGGFYNENHDEDSFQVMLDLTGQSMKLATAYANFRIEQAVDETGEDLVDTDNLTLKFNTRIRAVQQLHRPDGVPSVRVTAQIHKPSKYPAKLVRLKGRVQVMTLSADSRSLMIPKLAGYIAHPHEIKELVDEKLTIQVGISQPVDGKNIGKDVYAWINGNPTIVRFVQIIDDNGRVIAEGSKPDFLSNMKSYSLDDLPRVVDDRMSLRIEVAAGQKVITIPFDLKDVALR